jgi:hypothetical protein
MSNQYSKKSRTILRRRGIIAGLFGVSGGLVFGLYGAIGCNFVFHMAIQHPSQSENAAEFDTQQDDVFERIR